MNRDPYSSAAESVAVSRGASGAPASCLTLGCRHDRPPPQVTTLSSTLERLQALDRFEVFGALHTLLAAWQAAQVALMEPPLPRLSSAGLFFLDGPRPY
jgi:hypothetical protein